MSIFINKCIKNKTDRGKSFSSISKTHFKYIRSGMYDETPCNDIPESLEYWIYRREKNQNKVKSKGANKQKEKRHGEPSFLT